MWTTISNFKLLQDYRRNDLCTDLKRSINLAESEQRDTKQTKLVDEQDMKELLSHIQDGELMRALQKGSRLLALASRKGTTTNLVVPRPMPNNRVSCHKLRGAGLRTKGTFPSSTSTRSCEDCPLWGT